MANVQTNIQHLVSMWEAQMASRRLDEVVTLDQLEQVRLPNDCDRARDVARPRRPVLDPQAGLNRAALGG